MADLQGWPSYKGCRLTRVSVLQGWPSYKGGRLTRVSVLRGWPSYKGGRLTRVADLQGWPSYKGGRLTRVTVLQGWPSSHAFYCLRKYISIPICARTSDIRSPQCSSASAQQLSASLRLKLNNNLTQIVRFCET